VTGKYVKPSFKSVKRIKMKPEDCTLTENAFEALIDPGKFARVCELLQTKRRAMKARNDLNLVNEFAGIIKCADCGCSMAARTQTHQVKKRFRVSRNYVCGRYLRHSIHRYSLHYIKYSDVYDLVLRSIKTFAALAIEDKESLARQLAEMGNHQQKHEAEQCRRELKSAQKRLPELDRLVAKLYEEYVAERVSGDNYAMLMDKYQTEQDALKQRVETLNATLAKAADDASNIGEFVKLVEDFVNIDALTPGLVAQLIERIDVHEGVWDDGKRTQRVDIRWRFIGVADAEIAVC
jgi:hypothetical protein